MSLGMLTLVVVTGILSVARPGRAVSARAGLQAVHRELPLIATLLLAVHIGTAVADGFVPLRLVDVFVPFGAAWKPLYVGLGALAVDVLLVLLLTSVLRRRLSVSLWRGVHRLAYALWPLAVWHAVGAGSDARAVPVRGIGLACMAVVLVAVGRRLQVTRA